MWLPPYLDEPPQLVVAADPDHQAVVEHYGVLLAAAARAGLAPAGNGVTHGAEGAGMALRTAGVREMRLGWEVLRDVTVGVAPLRLARGDMLLGADYFAGRRVWVSYSGQRMFVQMPGR